MMTTPVENIARVTSVMNRTLEFFIKDLAVDVQ